MADLEDVINSLQKTTLSVNGVSFQGYSLKLNTAEDAKIVVDAIDNCSSLTFLNLEGNTLGVEAAEVIANALARHPEFKQALWKDMFTGRMKTEIPKALQFLGDGLVKAGAQLTILDLSDNAFGPTGVNGLASLLRSYSCYALEELRLNNNGLGIIGGKLLAQALLDCYLASSAAGKPLALRVFIAGRNRLENDGAIALAEVFKTLGSLEEIVMPQNGIYHIGISALSTAFQHNRNLRVLNLNDNTIGPKGAAAISQVLPTLQNLRHINFGDCLLKTKGAVSLASGLISISGLEELILGYNEIQPEGALELITAVANQEMLREFVLDGNQFNEDDRKAITTYLKQMDKQDIYSLDECDSEYDEEDTYEEDEEEEEDDAEDKHFEKGESLEIGNLATTKCSFNDFIVNPSGENFLGLGSDRENVILAQMKDSSDSFLDIIIPTLMKVSALTTNTQEEVIRYALKCSESLYIRLFDWTQTNNAISLTNNALLVHLGLIKSEDKEFKPTWDIKGCLFALENIIGRNYIPNSTKDTLQTFLRKDMDKNVELIDSKENLIKLFKT